MFLALIIFVVGFIVWFKHEIDTKGYVILNNTVYPETIDVEAKNTPEDTYSKFRQAILDDNVDGALEWIFIEDQKEYREAFSDEEVFKKYKTLPVVEEIKEGQGNGNFASYYYFENDQDPEKDIPFNIHFIKDETGYWKIDSI